MRKLDIELKEEQLELIKSKINQCKISVYRKTETKNVTVILPIEIENLVIIKEQDGKHESTVIPLSEEFYEHTKKKKILNHIDVYKNLYFENEHIDVDLKKEILNIDYETSGR